MIIIGNEFGQKIKNIYYLSKVVIYHPKLYHMLNCRFIRNETDRYKNVVLPLNSVRLAEIASRIQLELFPLLESTVNSFNSENRVIVTTGSDGRLENMPRGSMLELVIYGENLDLNLEKIVSAVFSAQLKTLKGVYIKPSEVEVHDIKKYPIMNYVNNIKGKTMFFPTRFIDSKFLGGNEKMYKNLWIKFIHEIQSINNKKIKEFSRKIADHKKTLETGKKKFKDTIIEYYNPVERTLNLYYKSKYDSILKNGPLRVYQYTLAKLMMVKWRKDGVSNTDIDYLIKMDKNILSKLEYLRDDLKKFIKGEQHFKEILDTYYYFLRLHNASKAKYYGQDKKVHLSYDDFNILQDRLDFVKQEVLKWQLN